MTMAPAMTIPKERRAVAYLRRSKATDTNPGNDSREAQEAAVRRLCGDDVAMYVDWGKSGSGDGARRPEYQRLKADIARGTVGTVCAYSLTRIGRNVAELSSFVKLCNDHNVDVRTATDNIDTTTASGRAHLGMLAVFSEYELETGKERTAAAMAAIDERYARAGLPVPHGPAIYGKRWVKREDGLRVSEDDPERPIGPVLDAYREAGSVLAACALLDRRGVPAPNDRNAKGWHRLSLRRILEHYAGLGLVELPEKVGHREARVPIRATALFSGILRCHCGATMTPNVNRRPYQGRAKPPQYICCAGRGKSDLHGQVTVTERKLRAALEPEAARYIRQTKVSHKASQSDQTERDRLAKARSRAEDGYLSGLIPAAKAKAQIASIDARLVELDSQAKRGLLLWNETIPTWDDVPAMNLFLRRIWRVVQLDENMVPTVEWGVPGYMYTDEDTDEDGAA